MKCEKCDQEAEYDSPADLCGEHWAEWMAYNQPDDTELLTPEEEKFLYDEIMEIVKEARKKESKYVRSHAEHGDREQGVRAVVPEQRKQVVSASQGRPRIQKQG